MASSKLLLKTNHFIFPWFWSPLSMILLKVTRIHPRSQIRNKRGEGERQGWRQATTYIESGPFRGQATHSAEHRSVQGAETGMETSTPTASLGQGLMAPGWAEVGSRAMGSVWPQGSWSGPLQAGGALRILRKERKRTWRDRASDQWLQIRDTWKQNEWQKCL